MIILQVPSSVHLPLLFWIFFFTDTLDGDTTSYAFQTTLPLLLPVRRRIISSTSISTRRPITKAINRTNTIIVQASNKNNDEDANAISNKRNNINKQTLLFRDAQTGVPVHIIGTMHYNPYSISKVESIIRYYGERNELGSNIIIESCPVRWKLIQQKQPIGSLLRKILDNEFQTASEMGGLYNNNNDDDNFGANVILADEDIEENDKRINKAFISSVQDYFNPFGGGWTSISNDIIKGYSEQVAPTSLFLQHLQQEDDNNYENNSSISCATTKEYLSMSDLFVPDMLLGTPISLARYSFAILQRKPIKGMLLFGWISLLVTLIVTRVGFDDGGVTITVASIVGFVLGLSVAIPLFGRVYLFALLGERNTIIANNIRQECIRMQVQSNVSSNSSSDTITTTSTETRLIEDNNDRNNQVCVVVLGLAHCNGVKRELLCCDTLGKLIE